MVLVDNVINVFDLLVINEGLVHVVGMIFENVLNDYLCVRHTLVYKCVELNDFSSAQATFSSSCFFASGVPDQPVLAPVMSRLCVPTRNETWNYMAVAT